MKNILFILLLSINLSSFSQTSVTKFLGIPVDGYKKEMIENLKEKGFTASKHNNEILEGEFNGEEVYIHIATNNNKVYRLMISDKNTRGETDIRIRFNKLCQQFLENKKYIPKSKEQNYEIKDSENIKYEIIVKDKRYEAAFAQVAEITDTLAIQEEIRKRVLNNITEEELSDTATINNLYKNAMHESLKLMLEKSYKNSVWFMICEYEGKFYISMYYDNENNMANGEDL